MALGVWRILNRKLRQSWTYSDPKGHGHGHMPSGRILTLGHMQSGGQQTMHWHAYNYTQQQQAFFIHWNQIIAGTHQKSRITDCALHWLKISKELTNWPPDIADRLPGEEHMSGLNSQCSTLGICHSAIVGGQKPASNRHPMPWNVILVCSLVCLVRLSAP